MMKRNFLIFHIIQLAIIILFFPIITSSQEKHKLIHFYFDIDVWELHDLENDPDELENLCNNPEYSKQAAKLKQQLKQLQVKYSDDIPLEEMREITRKRMVTY